MIETFYEFQPGDNTVPPVRTIARVGLDDRYFYASFWCEEPETSKIRAPYVDRDGVTDQQDYVGILLDVDNSRRSAVDFWIGPNGIQTDSMLNESPFGEDTSPDWFWESAGRDRDGRVDGRGPHPAVVAALSEQGSSGLGADGVSGLAAGVQLPVLQREDAARLELLPLLVGDACSPSRDCRRACTTSSRPTRRAFRRPSIRRFRPGRRPGRRTP